MTYISFYRKWRPQSFDDIIGQDYVVETLKNALSQNRLSHSYIFCGPRGTGKTSTARILAKAVNCKEGPTPNPCNKCENCISITKGNNVDVIEIDAASNNKVDQVRDLRDKVNYLPSKLRKKVYIIDEVHMLSNSAFNALLKTLEEPPEHILFIFATTEPQDVLPTIMSRCQRFDFYPISTKEITNRLKRIAEEENIEIDDAALGIIAKYADGSLRDADGILDQLSSFGQKKIGIDEVTSILGVVDCELLFEFTDILIEKDLNRGLFFIHRLFASNQSLNLLVLEFLEHLYNLYVYKNYDSPSELLETSDAFKELYSAQSKRITADELEFLMDLYSDLHKQIKKSEGAKTFFKTTLIKALSLGKAIKKEEETPAIENKGKVLKKKVKEKTKDLKEPKTSKKPKKEKVIRKPVKGDPIISNWEEICSAIKKAKVSVQAKFMETIGYSIEKDKIIFYLNKNNKWHKEQLNKERNKNIIAGAIKSVIGNNYSVEFDLKEKEIKGMVSLYKKERKETSKESTEPVEEKIKKVENIDNYFKEKFEIKE